MPQEVYECVVSGTLVGQFVQTVIHCSINNSGSTSAYAVAKDLNEDICASGGFIEALNNCCVNGYQQTSSRVKKVFSGGGPTNIILPGAMSSAGGARTGDISSAQANPLVIEIPTTDPSKTGRIFIPGISESDIDNMQYTSGWLTSTDDLITWLTASHITSTLSYTYRACIARKRQTTPHDVLSGDLVAAAYISPLVGTQRRRLHPL